MKLTTFKDNVSGMRTVNVKTLDLNMNMDNTF